MAKYKNASHARLSISNSRVFSTFFIPSHSNFAFRMKVSPRTNLLQPPRLNRREERIMQLLLTDCGERPMSRAKDGIVRKGEDFFAIVLQRVGVGHEASAHRPGEQGVADNCNPV